MVQQYRTSTPLLDYLSRPRWVSNASARVWVGGHRACCRRHLRATLFTSPALLGQAISVWLMAGQIFESER